MVAPILRCRRMGYDDSNIVIDVILNSGEELEKVNVDGYNAFEMIARTLKVVNYFSS